MNVSARLDQPARKITVALALALVWMVGVAAAGEQNVNADKPATIALADHVQQAAQRITDQALADGDYQQASKAAGALFQQVVTWCELDQFQALWQAAYTWRLMAWLSQVDDADLAGRTLAYLAANPDLGSALVFQLQADDKPAGVAQCLDHLRGVGDDVLPKYSELVAAMCVTHDVKHARQINENHVKSDDSAALLKYFIANESRMLFPLRDTPATLLTYMVDATGKVQELEWALSNYAGDAAVGKRFFEIKYDYNHFRFGAVKKVTELGLTLPNIKQYGGVCADQAYFAMSVGKAIGVPTTYTRGKSSSGGHAWVGYLQRQGRQAAWNFNAGRYTAYQGVRGWVLSPQAHREIPDSFLSLEAKLFGTRPMQRQITASYIDAARWLADQLEADQPVNVPPFESQVKDTLSEPRAVSCDAMLELLKQGLQETPGMIQGWLLVRDLAEADRLSLEQMKVWAEVINRLSGQAYPDFTAELLGTIIRRIKDPNMQIQLWEKLFEIVKRRSDLAAQVRMDQAELFLTYDQPKRAAVCYEDVINRYANAGPFILDALRAYEKLLTDSGREKNVAILYESTWGKLSKPMDAHLEFRKQSNWYKVGQAYLDWLRDKEMDKQAQRVEAQINREMGIE